MQGFDADVYVTQAASTLGIDLADADKTEVIRNFELIRQMAALVTQFAVPDTLDPAPIFEA